MPAYDLSALIQRFDTKADTVLTGRLSSALGESILLDLLAHALTAAGAGPVAPLPTRPHRDGTQFDPDSPAPTLRLPITSSVLVRAEVEVGPVLRGVAACGTSGWPAGAVPW